jgi:hypothetical protein
MTCSSGEGTGVGDWTSTCMTNGALCGSGEISIMSLDGIGDEEGWSGGVVASSDQVSQRIEQPIGLRQGFTLSAQCSCKA